MATPRPLESDRDRKRHDLDTDLARRRACADGDRAEKRELVDRTRQSGRGERQAHEGLARERAREDEGLEAERHESDEARTAERRLDDAALLVETEARTSADEALARADPDARRNEALREALTLVQTQIQLVTRSLAGLLLARPRDGFEASFGAGVETIRLASVRIERLLADALDPRDGCRRYHETGGSG